MEKKHFNVISIYAAMLFSLILTGCQGGGERRVDSAETLQMKYAETIGEENLSLLGGDYKRIAVDASVYKGLMEMLGVGDKCLDFSSQMKPDIEKIAASKADLLLLSSYEGMDIKKYERLGIPIVKCTDFLESSPLARAEWMRYFGRLWGVGEKADSLFEVVEKNYNQLCNILHNTGQSPKGKPERKNTSLPSPRGTFANEQNAGAGGEAFGEAFFDLLYGNIWYQPSPQSTTGKLVKDAGGKIPFKSDKNGGSLSLSAEQVLMQAQNADYWLIRANGNDNLTLAGLAKMNPIYSQFKAFKEGNVFACYTDKTNYFEETPFRPDWLLKDLKMIFSPPTPEGGAKLRYFQRIK